MDPPISILGPSSLDLKHTETLVSYLKQNHVFETLPQQEHRACVLDKLNKLLKVWVKKGKGEIQLVPFGSYRLGVNTPTGDIDVLMCGTIPRGAIFESLGRILQQHPAIKDCSIITAAFIPIIKFTIDGIDIDLIYSHVPPSLFKINLTTWNLRDPSEKVLQFDPMKPNSCDLSQLDPTDLHSLNGFRATEWILNLVPNQENFRIALRMIKFWAKQRDIYSNILGFFGGISWSILVAKICQLYPNAVSSTLLLKFFQFYSVWKARGPVTLNQIRLPRKSYDLVQILTPIEPCINSTHNASKTTWSIIEQEIERGRKLLEEGFNWARLCKKKQFFTRYKLFLAVHIENHGDEKVFGLVESKLRHFLGAIEKEPLIAIPYPHRVQEYFFIAIKAEKGTKQLDLRPATKLLRSLFEDVSFTLKFKTYTQATLPILPNTT